MQSILRDALVTATGIHMVRKRRVGAGKQYILHKIKIALELEIIAIHVVKGIVTLLFDCT